MSSEDVAPRQFQQGVQIGRQQVASASVKQSATDALRDREARSHSREDALSQRQFEQLVEATYRMKESQALEARTVLYLTGRLGLRGGEAAHFSEEWVNWQDRTIEIPDHDPCTKGQRGGEVCGYCRRRALERVKANNLSIDEAIAAIRSVRGDEYVDALDPEALREEAIALRKDVNLSFTDARAERWEPKTPASARTIPYDFDARIPLTLEAFCERYGGWENSKATLNRRIDRIAEVAELDENVYPHALRATAASAHASRDVSAYSLMTIMGWDDIATARSYIRSDDGQAAREVRSKHR